MGKLKIQMQNKFDFLGSQCFQDSVFLCLILLSVNKFGVFGIVNIIFFMDFEPLNAIIPGNTNVEQCWSPLMAGFP